MGPFGLRCSLSLLLPRLLPNPVQFLGEAHLGDKLLLKLPQQLVQKVVRLVYQADNGVGGNIGRGFFNIGPITEVW